MASLTPLGRQGSIKRTPSDLSQALAKADLPPPSFITGATRSPRAPESAEQSDDRIPLRSSRKERLLMISRSTTVLTMKHRRRESDRAQDAMTKHISSLDLGIPSILRPSPETAQVDSTTTPFVLRSSSQWHSRLTVCT